MTILVTGGTGDVGSHVVREFQERGAPFRAFVRDPDKARALHGPDVPLAIGDLGEPESIRRAMEGVDRVFLLCGGDPRQAEYESNVIDAAAAAGVERLVKISIHGAEVDSPLEWWDSQGRIEKHLAASGIPSVLLRPTAYMSKILGPPGAIKETGKVFAPASDARIAVVDSRDVASVAAVLLTDGRHEGQTYVLSGPKAITFGEMAEQLSAATDRTIEYVDVPEEGARQGMLRSGLPEWWVNNLITFLGFMRRGAIAEITDSVRALTGREPRSFAKFARDHADLY